MDTRFTPIKEKTAPRDIVDQITNYLTEKDVPPGFKLPSEEQLIEQFGASKSNIRQALQFLISIGALVSIPGRGHFVTEEYQIPIKTKKLQEFLLADKSFFELLEARELLEQNIAILAAERATKQDIQAMESAARKIKEVNSIDKQIDAASEVHLEIAKSTKNNVLVGLMEQLLPKIAQEAKDIQMPEEEDYRQHKLLVDKVREGDSEALEQAIVDHLEYMRTTFLEDLEQESSENTEGGNKVDLF